MKKLFILLFKIGFLIVWAFAIFVLTNSRRSDKTKVILTGTGVSSPEKSYHKFQPFGSDSEFYLYAAYEIEPNVVKVIGMRKRDKYGTDKEDTTILCRWGIGPKATVKGAVYEIREKWRAVIFVPVIITCTFHHTQHGLRASSPITLTMAESSVTLSILPHSALLPQYTLARCIPILYGPVHLPFLKSLLNVNSRFGVDHFQIYAHPSAFFSLTSLIQNVSSSNVSVSIKLWPLPVKPFEIFYYGQLVMLQDCLYSLRNRARYVLVADSDEYLLPLRDNTPLREMEHDGDNVGSWTFATTHAGLCFENISERRPNWKLTKYAVRPEKVRSLGVHRVIQYDYPGVVGRNVSDENAVVLHCHLH